jgi:hypothetical protein
MKTNKAFIVPYANVEGAKKTIIMRTELGTGLVLAMSPEVNKVYLIEGNPRFENYSSFQKRVSELVEKIKGKMLPEIENSIEKFSINCGYDATRLIPQRN